MQNVIAILSAVLSLFWQSCVSGPAYNKTVAKIDLERFMGKWYVIASRATFLEKGAHNAIETYTLADNGKDIDIDFRFNKDSFTGKEKEIPQSGQVYNEATKAHWKVSPFWPLSFDYLIIAVDENYQWSVIGVPNQKYLWLLGRRPNFSDAEIRDILQNVAGLGYEIKAVERVPQQH